MTQRHVPLEGCFNLRDLGGHESTLGGTVRRGCLFRSDELHHLTDADLEVVAGLGVRVVFDLRNDEERRLRPSRLWDGVHLHERESPSAQGGSGATIEERIERGESFDPNDEEFGDVYVRLITHLAPELRRIVELAANASELPLLFHCAAGKDRTGIAAALLLGLLGVDEETILDDYELTNEHFVPRRYALLEPLVLKHGANAEHVRTFCSARRPVLAKAIHHIHDAWGGFEGYATDMLGVDNSLLVMFREGLLQ
ncbi:MAG TPA: tyrosine-protein phosphatase [Acidimicrobiales bacterium]|nr:tyrosine-protein phosphatase [Acidimicrobiales bacterium]